MSDYSFMTIDMIMSDNLVPAKYTGQDVRLVYSRENPAHMGYWFTKGKVHERAGLFFLVREVGMTAAELAALPVAYYKD